MVGKGKSRVLEQGYLGANCTIDEVLESHNLKVNNLIQVGYYDLV